MDSNVEQNVKRINDSIEQLKKALADDKTALESSKVTVPDGTKHSDIAGLIRSISATPKVYGVKVKRDESDPEKRVVYTDDAVGMTPVEVSKKYGRAYLHEWGDTWIFDKIYPVLLNESGKVLHRLDRSNIFKAENGDGNGANDPAASKNNAMVHVGRFYSKYSMEDGYECYQVCDEPLPGFEPIGFVGDDGGLLDCFYMPCYMGCIDSDGMLRSLNGNKIATFKDYDTFVTAAEKYAENGYSSGFCLEAHAQVTALDILYLILLKNDDSQTAVGTGRGLTDAVTGVTNALGPIGCDPTTGAVTFLWMEDYWFSSDTSGEQNPKKPDDFGYRWMRGMIWDDAKQYVKMSGPYSNGDPSGYTFVGVDPTETASGFVSQSIASNSLGRIPTAFSGTADTYQCDSYFNGKSDNGRYVCYRGGGGVWRRAHGANNHTSYHLGGALSYLPTNGA